MNTNVKESTPAYPPPPQHPHTTQTNTTTTAPTTGVAGQPATANDTTGARAAEGLGEKIKGGWNVFHGAGEQLRGNVNGFLNQGSAEVIGGKAASQQAIGAGNKEAGVAANGANEVDRGMAGLKK